MPKGHRKTEQHQRRIRARKFVGLREQYLKTRDEEQKAKILEKVRKIAPWLSREGFLLEKE